MKLLIVEDNSGVRRLIRRVVASVADEIRECADGAEALALCAAERPDFVLMDIQMKTIGSVGGCSAFVIVPHHRGHNCRLRRGESQMRSSRISRDLS